MPLLKRAAMIDSAWLVDRLSATLRWQLAHPGASGGPEIPWAGRRVWSIFLELDRARGSNGWSPNPIKFVDIEAYARLMREPVRPFEVEIIRALDAVYMKVTTAPKGEGKTVPRSSGQGITPAAFDAVFG
jgi:hypothetical protein